MRKTVENGIQMRFSARDGGGEGPARSVGQIIFLSAAALPSSIVPLVGRPTTRSCGIRGAERFSWTNGVARPAADASRTEAVGAGTCAPGARLPLRYAHKEKERWRG